MPAYRSPHDMHATRSWLAIIATPPYNLDHAPSDFHLFGPLKLFLGGQHSNSDDEVKQSVLSWFRRNDKSFYTAGIQALVKCWDKCVNVAGDYIEK